VTTMSFREDTGFVTLRRRDWLPAAIWGALAASGLPCRAYADEPSGRVEDVRGEAFARVGSRQRPLSPAAEVFVGDLVATGANSALGLRLGAATRIRLGAEAQLRIDRFLIDAGGVLELGRGAMLFDRSEAAPPADTAVRTPFGLIAVRGTRFFAGPSNGVFGVFVDRGRVIVAGSSSAVEVRAGFGTDIAAPGANPTDPHPWAAARVERAFAEIR